MKYPDWIYTVDKDHLINKARIMMMSEDWANANSLQRAYIAATKHAIESDLILAEVTKVLLEKYNVKDY